MASSFVKLENDPVIEIYEVLDFINLEDQSGYILLEGRAALYSETTDSNTEEDILHEFSSNLFFLAFEDGSIMSYEDESSIKLEHYIAPGLIYESSSG